MTDALTVYVPAEGSHLREGAIREGAGIVGSEVGETGRMRIDFEGDDDLFPTFGKRVRRAAERHSWTGPNDREGYPTRACAYVSPEELTRVGEYRPNQKKVHVTAEEPLKEWLGVASIREEHLTAQ